MWYYCINGVSLQQPDFLLAGHGHRIFGSSIAKTPVGLYLQQYHPENIKLYCYSQKNSAEQIRVWTRHGMARIHPFPYAAWYDPSLSDCHLHTSCPGFYCRDH